MLQKGSKKQPVKFLDKDTQYLKNKLFDVIKTLNDQAINKWQQCMLGSQSGKNIPQLMFQYAYFKLIFYQQFKRLTFHWH